MRISVDLDGTLTIGDHSLIHYLAMVPDDKAIAKINKLRSEGNEIFIYTARPFFEHEKICRWLDEQGVLYDHVECGKLATSLYVDNNSKRIDEL